MRIVEIENRPSIVLNNEETELFEYIQFRSAVVKKELDPRQQYLVNQLVNKDLVIRRKVNGNITYTISPRI
jgi:hypothetical protein